ncbi:MAG: alpha-amylase, partial [Bacteroidales bacterium]|nr:alpha-amylase [Bacteroidales bacterium]
LGKNLAKEKQAAAFLLTAGGKPFIYQGEELGYWGTKSKGDEYVRTPMMWTKSNTGLASKRLGSKIDKSMLTASISVESQLADEESLLNVYKTFSALRNTYPALAEGLMSITFIDDPAIASWYMTSGNSKLLVIHNVANSDTTVKVTESMDHCIALLGTAYVDGTSLKLGANSSVVFEL